MDDSANSSAPTSRNDLTATQPLNRRSNRLCERGHNKCRYLALTPSSCLVGTQQAFITL